MANVIEFPSEAAQRTRKSQKWLVAKIDAELDAIPKPIYSTRFLYALTVFNAWMITPTGYIAVLAEFGCTERWNAMFLKDKLVLMVGGVRLTFGTERIPEHQIESLKKLAADGMKANEKIFQEYQAKRDAVCKKYE